MKKRIGILGSGQVAKTLAGGFLSLGHEVMLGSRDAGKLADWQQQAGKGARSGTFSEAAAFGEVIVLAVLGRAAIQAVELAGAENLTGKTILDTTNPIAEAPPKDGVIQFFTDGSQSLIEQIQAACPAGNFVKAFNSVGSPAMFKPKYKEGKPTMFICGNSEAARQEASAILNDFGWEVADMGTAVAGRAIEPLCILWCIPGFLQNSWTHAFKLLKVDEA